MGSMAVASAASWPKAKNLFKAGQVSQENIGGLGQFKKEKCRDSAHTT
jgi:hypothetical protein